MVSVTIRRLGAFVFWLGLFVVVLCATFFAILEHYLALKSGLEIAGFEPIPIKGDELVGPFLTAFVPNATLPEATALTIALFDFLAFLIVFDALFWAVELAQFHRASKAAERPDEAAEAKNQLIATGVVLFVSLVLLFPALGWEISIWRFRSIAGAMGIEHLTNVGGIPDWEQLRETIGGTFIYQLARIGAWGYIAFTALGCIALDQCGRRMGRQLSLLLSPLDLALASHQGPYDLRARSDSGFRNQPTAGTIQSQSIRRRSLRDRVASAFAALRDWFKRIPRGRNQRPAYPEWSGSFQPSPVSNQPWPSRMPNVAQFVPWPQEPSLNPDHEEVASQAGPISLGQRDPDPQPQPQSQPQPQPQSWSLDQELRDVIGSKTRQRITLSDALSNPKKYFVDRATGRIWDRTLHDLLHEVPSSN